MKMPTYTLRKDDCDYLISLFTFRENYEEESFYKYCDSSAELISKRPGFRGAWGYKSTYENAKYPYVGVTALASLQVLYDLLDEDDLSTRLAPPDSASAMTLVARCKYNTYPIQGEHREITDESIIMINPFSISQADRDSEKFGEMMRRNKMAISTQPAHVGYRGFYSTNPSAIHNYVGVSEWANEADFLAHANSDAFKVANRGRNNLVDSGYPGIYKLVLAVTDDGFALDKRIRQTT